MLDSELWGTVITALTDTQTFTVTPDDEQTIVISTTASENQRQYTVTNAVADTEHQIVLFDADNVDVDANGVVTFTAAGTTGAAATQADPGSVGANITVVNGSNVVDGPAQSTDPVGGQITFTVEALTLSSVVPVVYFDADEDGTLDIDADGAPVDAEVFGIGGQINILPAESDSVTLGVANNLVVFVDKDADLFVIEPGVIVVTDPADFVTMSYDAADNFFVDDTTPSKDTPAQQTDLAGFEGALAVGDLILGADETVYSQNFQSTFVLLNQVPGTPQNVTAVATSDTEVEVTWDEPTAGEPDSYNVYRAATLTGTFANASVIGTVAGDATDLEFEDSGLAAETGYNYFVTAVKDGVESDEDSDSVTTLSAGDVAALASEVAIVTTDAGLLDVVEENDEWVIGFNREVNVGATWQIAVRDADGDGYTVSNSNASISQNAAPATFAGETYAAGELLTVNLAGTPPDGDDALSYPVNVVNSSGITTVGGAAPATAWSIADSTDVTLNVNTTLTVTTTAVDTVVVAAGTNSPAPEADTTITATVEDVDGDGIEGVIVDFSGATNGSLSAASAVTDANGVATVTYTAGLVGEADTITGTARHDGTDDDTGVIEAT